MGCHVLKCRELTELHRLQQLGALRLHHWIAYILQFLYTGLTVRPILHKEFHGLRGLILYMVSPILWM